MMSKRPFPKPSAPLPPKMFIARVPFPQHASSSHPLHPTTTFYNRMLMSSCCPPRYGTPWLDGVALPRGSAVPCM